MGGEDLPAGRDDLDCAAIDGAIDDYVCRLDGGFGRVDDFEPVHLFSAGLERYARVVRQVRHQRDDRSRRQLEAGRDLTERTRWRDRLPMIMDGRQPGKAVPSIRTHPIQHHRLECGLRRRSPVVGIRVDAGTDSRHLRRTEFHVAVARTAVTESVDVPCRQLHRFDVAAVYGRSEPAGSRYSRPAPQRRAVLERLEELLGTDVDTRGGAERQLRGSLLIQNLHDHPAATQVVELVGVEAHAELLEWRQVPGRRRLSRPSSPSRPRRMN